MTQLAQVKKAAAYINKKTKNFKPEIALITGSGLAGSIPPLEKEVKIPYTSIPGFLQSTVPGHSGNLIFGVYKGRNIVVMQGRFHYYEGYGMQQVTFPVGRFTGTPRVMATPAGTSGYCASTAG